MGYSTVPYVNSGSSWTASQHNTYIRDNFTALWPFTAAGDMVVSTSPYAITKLPIGVDNTLLVNSSNELAWKNLSQIYCNVASSTTSISPVTWEYIQFDTIIKNNYGMFDETSGYKFISPFTGVYLVTGFVQWSASTQEGREIQYYNSNLDKWFYIDTRAASEGVCVNDISLPVYLPKGAYLYFMVYQGSGSSLDMSSNFSMIYWGS